MNQSFFSELPQDLLSDPKTSSEVIFNAFNSQPGFDQSAKKDRDNFVKSLIRPFGFQREIPIDQVALDTFFCDVESATAIIKSQLSNEDEERLLEIRFIIHNLLPDFERDIMTLIFDYNKIQEDIGVLLGLSQEMVNYYKKRAIHRILHFYNHRKVDINDMRACLTDQVSKRQLEAMMLYFFRHNQRVISKELKISQSAVSARLKQGLKKLKKRSKHDKKVLRYYQIFNNLSKQKSLYSSQTRMQLITEVDNYRQFDENNQRITIPKLKQIVKEEKVVKKTRIRKRKKIKIKLRSRHHIKKAKKLHFNSKKLKKVRHFFKR